jgi:hypothetical protein
MARITRLLGLRDHEMEGKMTIKNESDETEECLYYSRVEPHIGPSHQDLNHELHNQSFELSRPSASIR